MDRVVWNALEVDASGALRIAHFRPSMQEAFQWLVLDGLAERWGSVDESLNPDLRDIDARYGEDIVLVALDDEQVVGTGILVLRPTAGEIVRMSVHRTHRRRGKPACSCLRCCNWHVLRTLDTSWSRRMPIGQTHERSTKSSGSPFLTAPLATSGKRHSMDWTSDNRPISPPDEWAIVAG
jgi:hypothetical protein